MIARANDVDEVDRQRQTDNLGFGGDKRRQGNKDVLDNKESFRYTAVDVSGLDARFH